MPILSATTSWSCWSRRWCWWYPHEHNVTCNFVDGKLRLVAENDYDPEGLNLMDEFSDNICAYIEPFDGDIKLISVETIS